MANIEIEGKNCLTAAEQIQRKLLPLCRKIEQLQDPSVGPNHPLPVDNFLAKMDKRINAPRIVLKPKRLKDHLWTESVTAYVYAGIEKAFVRAGRLPGSNRAGHKAKLKELKSWAQQQATLPLSTIPKDFVRKNALLFAAGILDERREERIAVLMNIQNSSRTRKSDLDQLEEWIEHDLADNRINVKGRSQDYQKIAFANEIAKLWKELTGRDPTKGPNTNFAKFLTACWESGFVDLKVNSNFKRILRDHITV